MVDSSDLAQVLAEAEDISQSVNQKLTSAHLLLALFTVENRADVLLRERGVDEDRILQVMTRAPSEADGLVRELCERTREVARNSGSREADCLHHLLITVTRVRCAAQDLLIQVGVELTALRNTALSYFLSGRSAGRSCNWAGDRRHSLAIRRDRPGGGTRGTAPSHPRGAEATPQQRPIPAPLDLLTDADPASRRWAILLAAALLVLVALATAGVAGALLDDRDVPAPLDISLEPAVQPPADLPAFVRGAYDAMPQLAPYDRRRHGRQTQPPRLR